MEAVLAYWFRVYPDAKRQREPQAADQSRSLVPSLYIGMSSA